jgi:hypothetical protein
MTRVVSLGLLYFVLVFGAGFVLGPIRVLFVEPHIGTRAAELIDLAIMAVWIWVVARWLLRRFAVLRDTRVRLAMGGIAVALSVLVDFTVVLRLRDMTLSGYVASFDPVAGTAFWLMQVVFALMPWWLGRDAGRSGCKE